LQHPSRTTFSIQQIKSCGRYKPLGTTGPIVVSIALFGVIAGVNIEEYAQKPDSLDSMRILYVFCRWFVLLAAALFHQKNYRQEKRSYF
jgi:FHS family L-fucose permease-like MFS transporter